MSVDSFDLGEALGAEENVTPQRISVYLPNRDRNGNPVANIDAYIEAAMTVLTDINRGATKLPPSQGRWVSEDGQDMSEEDTVLVYSFVRRPDVFMARIEELKGFLHTFGREANQGEVLVEFSGENPEGGYMNRSFWISKYMPEPG